jgi:hypothetical protein
LHISGPSHVDVIPKGSEVIVFLKAWIIGKTIANLWSKKFNRSGIKGINGDNIGPRIWEFTKLKQRRKVIENETICCFDKAIISMEIGHEKWE